MQKVTDLRILMEWNPKISIHIVQERFDGKMPLNRLVMIIKRLPVPLMRVVHSNCVRLVNKSRMKFLASFIKEDVAVRLTIIQKSRRCTWKHTLVTKSFKKKFTHFRKIPIDALRIISIGINPRIADDETIFMVNSQTESLKR